MFILGNFVMTLARLVDWVLVALWWLILVRALISWVNPDPFNPIVQFLYRMTEPILEQIRRVVPPLGGFDLSPIVAFLLIMVLQSFLVQSLMDLAIRLGN